MLGMHETRDIRIKYLPYMCMTCQSARADVHERRFKESLSLVDDLELPFYTDLVIFSVSWLLQSEKAKGKAHEDKQDGLWCLECWRAGVKKVGILSTTLFCLDRLP